MAALTDVKRSLYIVPMSKRVDILNAAEKAFEANGFHAVPIDVVIAGASVSPRTLYKHFPGKTDLAVAVLERRHERFLDAMKAAIEGSPDPMDALFDALETWLQMVPSTGCLFLRAMGEFGDAPIVPVVTAHKQALRDVLARLVDALGAPAEKVDPLFILIEGATALCPTLGARTAVDAARRSARELFA